MTDPEEFTVTELLPEAPAEEPEQDCIRILDSRYRAWLFTYNNYTKEVMQVIDEQVAPDAQYLVYGEEVAPTTGTPHLQGYMYFKSARKGSALKKMIGTGLSLRKANGTAEQNRKYCTKEGQFKEFGTIPKQGERSDLKDLVGSLSASHKSIEELALGNPQAYHQYGRTLHFIHGIKLREQKRDFMTEGVWMWGKTGVGKSHDAVHMCMEKQYSMYEYEYHKNGWWNNYRGQDAVIFHEFDKHTMSFEQLKRMVDKYPFNVPQTNVGTVPFMSKFVIICSDRPPWNIYDEETTQSIGQLFRRFKMIRKCGIDRQKNILYSDYCKIKEDGDPSEKQGGFSFAGDIWPHSTGVKTFEAHGHPHQTVSGDEGYDCKRVARLGHCESFPGIEVPARLDGSGFSPD